jgi:hypothetical protein
MIALGPEHLLKPVVGARQAGDGVAMEQAGPVAALVSDREWMRGVDYKVGERRGWQ